MAESARIFLVFRRNPKSEPLFRNFLARFLRLYGRRGMECLLRHKSRKCRGAGVHSSWPAQVISLLFPYFAHVYMQVPVSDSDDEMPAPLSVGMGEPGWAERQLRADRGDCSSEDSQALTNSLPCLPPKSLTVASP